MNKYLRQLKDNRSGFTFVELLVVIVIMAVLVAASANYLFSQGGSKARDIERKNDMKQVGALLEQFTSSYGEPPSDSMMNRKVKERLSDCAGVTEYKGLMKCFGEAQYVVGEGLIKLAEDPKEGITSEKDVLYVYRYGANSNGWKLCALLENQTDPDLNDTYDGKGSYDQGEDGKYGYCLWSTNRKQTHIQGVAGDIDDGLSFMPAD